MTQLYRRQPKNWLERIWLRIRPQIVYAEYKVSTGHPGGRFPLGDFPAIPGGELYLVYNNKQISKVYDKEWFEANYEPILCEHQKAWVKFNLSPKIDICPVCQPEEYRQTVARRYERDYRARRALRETSGSDKD